MLVPRLHKISRFQDFKISRFQDGTCSCLAFTRAFKMRLLDSMHLLEDAFTRYQDIKISRYQDVKISRFRFHAFFIFFLVIDFLPICKTGTNCGASESCSEIMVGVRVRVGVRFSVRVSSREQRSS